MRVTCVQVNHKALTTSNQHTFIDRSPEAVNGKDNEGDDDICNSEGVRKEIAY